MTVITEEELGNPAIHQYLFKLVGAEGLELLHRWSNPEYSHRWLEAKLGNAEVKDTDKARFLAETRLENADLSAVERSDEEIADITGINLNSVRHTLYNLYEHRLAEYRRIKNNETGWLTYLWVMRMDHLKDVLRSEMEVAVGKLSARLRYDETNDFYQCKNCGITTTFNAAMNTNFACPQCGSMLEHFDDELLVTALRKRVEKMQTALENA
ncbi:MAG: transcription factor [Methanocorpusculum sp.]|jgi:transcription initiation factor TFIIE subunit alpha|nr:transcription factor [Methanocorpusculum sp.]MDD2470564.1 TFIIB-type zinc ribbon-containing protein [Methanocorpusculum sp.]MDD4132352.1 TFIIB-type zinc ribbon-containing protein [Methanocorpusculum sp.]